MGELICPQIKSTASAQVVYFRWTFRHMFLLVPRSTFSENHMITDWHQTLSRVTGAVINGEERITTHELLTHHLGVPYSDRAARKLKRIMRRLRWRARKIRLGRETRNGYCRKV